MNLVQISEDQGQSYENSDNESEFDDVPVYVIENDSAVDRPWNRRLLVNGVEISMQLDSGAGVSVIPFKLYEKYFSSVKISPTNIKLRMYNGQSVLPRGKIQCSVRYKTKYVENLDLIVVDQNNSPAILGRRWMTALGIECSRADVMTVEVGRADATAIATTGAIAGSSASASAPAGGSAASTGSSLRPTEVLDKLKSAFPTVFSPGIGKFNKGIIKLSVKPEAQPVHCRPRPVPYALRDRIDAELDRMMSEGIISPVETSDWGTPVVPVIKRSGDIRLCGDFKITLNPVLEDDKYPVPRIEDIFATLQGGCLFSKIDLCRAYQQLVLSPESRMLCVIVTHRGNFCYNRLPFGVKCAVSKFQRVLENLLRIPHVSVYLDDILVTGRDVNDHYKKLFTVFEILSDSGLKVAPEKCKLFQRAVSYLGYVIDATGLHTETDKVDAIVNAPVPTDVPRLRAFLGLINYYAKFLPNLSTILHPLHNLLKKGQEFVWSGICDDAFREVKRLLAKKPVLAHYNPELELRVYCDASPYGVGAALVQRSPNGDERPVLHASRALTTAERNYAQICREGLAIIFAVQKFHHYVFGRHFILITDCKPLAAIFGEHKSIPQMIAGRLQRWAVILSGYDYKIECIKSDENCVADSLSRLPTIEEVASDKQTCEFVSFIEEATAVSYQDIAESTRKDPVLARLLAALRGNWQYCSEQELEPFWRVRASLSVEHGCVLHGARVLVPAALRPRVLRALHAAHQGMVRTKALARGYVWWPGLDADLEQMCRECDTCALERPTPPRAALHPWAWPQVPWYRVHVDFLSPKAQVYYFILVDAHSKWVEASKISGTSAIATIALLRQIFARFGNPYELVSDNGPPFTSAEFASYLNNNGIKHIAVSPYKPSSNGAAENSVKLVKSCLRKAAREKTDPDEALQTFLLMYRCTPHTTTGRTPSELLLKRTMRTVLDIMKPDAEEIIRNVQRKQINATAGTDRAAREFKVGDRVLFKMYRLNKSSWEKGEVVARLGPLTYHVKSGELIHKRHVDQIILDTTAPVAVGELRKYSGGAKEQGLVMSQVQSPTSPPPSAISERESNPVQTASSLDVGTAVPPPPPPQSYLTQNRPMRNRHPPQRYGFEID